MGVRGAPAQDAELKALRGNPGCRPIQQPPKVPGGWPKPPPGLTAPARAIWRYTCKVLGESRIVSTADRDHLTRYCAAQAEVMRLQKIVGKCKLISGSDELGDELKLFRALQSALRTATDLAVQLGLTPAARARLKAPEPEQQDELEAFLRGPSPN